jgi:dienelactone hydrolase
MAWLEEIAAHAFDDPAGAITEISTGEVEVGGERAGRITLRFRVRDMRGEPHLATADVLLPALLADDPDLRVPTWFGCWYEVEPATAERQLRLGRAVFSIRGQGDAARVNPFLRSPNADYVLAHLARGARFVDPTAIVYGGGSAGGATALMVAAEAFPATAAVALGPPVNEGYEAAYVSVVYPRFVADPPQDHPVIQMITTMFAQAIEPWKAVYGEFGSHAAFDHSAVAHVDHITGPVLVMTSTADFLVPVEQFSREFAEATLADPPKHVTIAAEDLDPSPRIAVRLVDVLGDRADVRRIPLPEGAEIQRDFDQTMQQPKLPVDVGRAPANGKQWLVSFLDEGPIVLGATHGLHAVEADTEPFVQTALAGGIWVEQLTAAKLEQLLDRYTGVEWLAPGFRHLDEPAAEQADVLRGIRLYCAQSDVHAQRFAELYSAVDESRRVLAI